MGGDPVMIGTCIVCFYVGCNNSDLPGNRILVSGTDRSSMLGAAVIAWLKGQEEHGEAIV